MLDLYELQVFLAAAETENFSEAGRRLQLSQPAVSMQIRSLETHLGMDLFHRAGRHIALTEAGQALVPLARE
jgi:DNA-binding transcriptional LysR family regulator